MIIIQLIFVAIYVMFYKRSENVYSNKYNMAELICNYRDTDVQSVFALHNSVYKGDKTYDRIRYGKEQFKGWCVSSAS